MSGKNWGDQIDLSSVQFVNMTVNMGRGLWAQRACQLMRCVH